MKLDFESVLSHTLTDFEGGYANSKKDAGGETFAGVSRKSNPDWSGWPMVDAVKEKHKGTSARSLAIFINNALLNDPAMLALLSERYYLNYWKPVEIIEAQRVRAKVFDFGVHAGTVRAIKMLQKTVMATVDGIVGPRTNAAVRAKGEDATLSAFCQRQEAYYDTLIKNNPQYEIFRAGWMRRARWKP